ncbi:MAG: hypothetical protein LBD14_01290 [Puniceicoccales bacterium]|nr:hypothetical protein [Puniceicoccales bacterium]
MDSVKTYWHYAGKASGAGHEKPAGWYVATFFGKFNVGRRVFSIEGVTGVLSVLVPVLLCFRGWWCRGEWRAAVFTWTSGASLLLLYSLIGYKTPWLFLGVLPPLWVASGLGVMTLARRMCGVGCCVAGGVGVSRRGACVAALCMVAGAVVCGALYKNCWWLTRRLAADERNPLAYAHAVDDVKRVTQLAERMAAVEEGFYARVFIAGSEYWPLPWYLRHWTAAHWVGVPPVGREEFLDAPMVITDAVTDAEVASRLRGKYFMDFLGLRPGVLLYLRLREDLWQRIMAQPEGGEVAK